MKINTTIKVMGIVGQWSFWQEGEKHVPLGVWAWEVALPFVLRMLLTSWVVTVLQALTFLGALSVSNALKLVLRD